MKQVRKNEARKLFNKGVEIYLYPCKGNVNSSWYDNACTINNVTDHFDLQVNNFEYHNCNSETGYYAKYYVGEERK